MERHRIPGLDACAVSIAEIREQMGSLRADETAQLTTALNLMRRHEKNAWRHAGVEFVRVPGEEKLRVRTSKEQATAETETEPAGDAAAGTDGQ